MTIKIDKKITKYRVHKPEDEKAQDKEPAVRDAKVRRQDPSGKVVWMHEKLERPEVLIGSTYKVKTPVSDHAMYVTINDIVLNEGTPHEQRRPFEIFINSKNLDHFQWIVALTRVISAVLKRSLPLVSHSIFNASAAFLACQKPSAITPMPLTLPSASRHTTW